MAIPADAESLPVRAVLHRSGRLRAAEYQAACVGGRCRLRGLVSAVLTPPRTSLSGSVGTPKRPVLPGPARVHGLRRSGATGQSVRHFALNTTRFAKYRSHDAVFLELTWRSLHCYVHITMERRTAPPSASALSHRRRSGWTPRPVEYDQLVTVTRRGTPLRRNTLSEAFNRAKERARAKGVMVPPTATFRDLRDFMDAVLIAAGVRPRSVQARMRHGKLAETLDTYGFALEVDWENASAFFEGSVRHPGASRLARDGTYAALAADRPTSQCGGEQAA